MSELFWGLPSARSWFELPGFCVGLAGCESIWRWRALEYSWFEFSVLFAKHVAVLRRARIGSVDRSRCFKTRLFPPCLHLNVGHLHRARTNGGTNSCGSLHGRDVHVHADSSGVVHVNSGGAAFLQQASGRMHGEAWAGRLRFLSHVIFTKVGVLSWCPVFLLVPLLLSPLGQAGKLGAGLGGHHWRKHQGLGYGCSGVP